MIWLLNSGYRLDRTESEDLTIESTCNAQDNKEMKYNLRQPY